MPVGVLASHDIFTVSHRWGDLDEWNRTALALREEGPIPVLTDRALCSKLFSHNP